MEVDIQFGLIQQYIYFIHDSSCDIRYFIAYFIPFC